MTHMRRSPYLVRNRGAEPAPHGQWHKAQHLSHSIQHLDWDKRRARPIPPAHHSLESCTDGTPALGILSCLSSTMQAYSKTVGLGTSSAARPCCCVSSDTASQRAESVHSQRARHEGERLTHAPVSPKPTSKRMLAKCLTSRCRSVQKQKQAASAPHAAVPALQSLGAS